MHMTNEPGIGHLDEEALILHHFGEDGGAARDAARRHLAACERCREELALIGEVLGMVASSAEAQPPEGFERVMWARVCARLEAGPARGWRTWVTVPRLAVAGVALTLVVAAFVAGRWTRQAPPVPSGELLVVLAPDTALRLATEDHLERAQMMLVEVLHADANDPALDAERQRAVDLVAASRLIRQSSTGSGDAAMSALLEDLERVLLEIANRADGWSGAELAAFKARIDAGDMLFRLRVISAEMRQRGQRRAPVT